ncbi:hypothetical protein K490DRAFT_60112 [Saccharata proteae CBS 121410]|uniref:Uncharacterized protein n=1 Tax=Saccharata proteae CBS 121410 TaxID=1314787 RepID=A0A9P4HLK5_9PEZI|nr:hypothetical protein K490DRAFT_60112 [Saccharata proteae CBS 121410]
MGRSKKKAASANVHGRSSGSTGVRERRTTESEEMDVEGVEQQQEEEEGPQHLVVRGGRVDKWKPAAASIPQAEKPDGPIAARQGVKKAKKSKSRRPANEPDATVPEKKRKKEPTTTRLSGTQKARLASSNVALYAALARSVKKGQAGLLTGLRGYLSSLKMSGHKKTVASGSYYAVVFDTTKHRDEAFGKITQDVFPKFLRQDKTEVRIDVAKFGAQSQEGPRIWSIAADPLATIEDLVESVTKHVARYMPVGFETTVTIAAKMESEKETGGWAVGFGEAPPKNTWRKQMKGTDGETWLVSQEPPSVCRFCSRTGHNIFSCEGETTKSVSEDRMACEVKGEQMEGQTESGTSDVEMS